MTYPVLPTGQRRDPHALSPEYVQGVIEGCLAARSSYRCLRPWHLMAMSRRTGDGAYAMTEHLIAEGTVLSLDPSWMPGVFFLHGRPGYITVRALQELAPTTGRPRASRTRSPLTSRAQGTPSPRRACAPGTP